MNYGQIRKYDVANGPGIRTSIFVTGCIIRCEGCFNSDYWSYNGGSRWTLDVENYVISVLKLDHVAGLSVLGGEPLAQDDDLLKFLKKVKMLIKKSVWLWSGFCFEGLNSKQLEVLNYVDVLIDGPFKADQRDLKLKYRGSSNQRVIDLKETRRCKKLVLLV